MNPYFHNATEQDGEATSMKEVRVIELRDTNGTTRYGVKPLNRATPEEALFMILEGAAMLTEVVSKWKELKRDRARTETMEYLSRAFKRHDSFNMKGDVQ